jgi:hypothetical protein
MFWINKLINEGHPLTNQSFNGGGRKPVNGAKKAITFYIAQSKIDLIGGDEKMREWLYEMVENDFTVNPISERQTSPLKFQKATKEGKSEKLKTKVDYAKTTPESYDAENQSNIKHDEVGQFKQPPPRLEGESTLDYKIRISEQNHNLSN